DYSVLRLGAWAHRGRALQQRGAVERLRLPGQLVAGRRLSAARLPGRGLDAPARRRGQPAAVSGLREASNMATTYELTDDSVVVIIGSGAGGGTLGNELA